MIKAFIKTSSIYLGSTIIEKAIALVFFAYIARLLSIEEMGEYALYGIYATILSFLISLEIKSGYGRFYVEHDGEARKHFEMTILVFSLLTNLFFATILYFLYDVINSFIAIPFDIFLIILILPLIDTIIYIGLYKARYENKDYTYVGISLSRTILNIFIFFALINLVEENILRLFASSLLSGFVVMMFVYFRFFYSYQVVLDKSLLHGSLKFSVWLIPSSIGSYISRMTDRVMLEKMTNTQNVGIYSAFQKLSSLVMLSLEPLYNAFMPNVMKNYKDDSYDDTYFFMFHLLLTIMLFINITLAVFAKEFTLLLLGAKYESYCFLVYLFLGINVFDFISRILANNIHLSKNSKFDTITETTTGVLNLILNFIFIYYFGLIGAIYATLITYFIRFVMYDFFAKKLFNKYKISLRYYFYYLLFTFLIFLILGYIHVDLQFISKVFIYILLICFCLLFFYFNLNATNKIKLKFLIVKKFQG